MSYNAYNSVSLGRSLRKPYEVGDEQYQHSENRDQPKEDSWQPSPLMRLRQPMFQTQREPPQEFHFPTARELDESLIEDEQFTLVQKVIQSTLDQEDFLPEENLQLSTFEQQPIGIPQQPTLRDESFLRFQHFQPNDYYQNNSLQDFQPSTMYEDFFSEARKPPQSIFQKGQLSPTQNRQQSITDHDRYSTVRKFQQPAFQGEPISLVPELPEDQISPVDQNQFSLAQHLRRPKPQQEQFLPIQQLRQPTLQNQDFLPLQQLRQPSALPAPRRPEQPPLVEHLRQPWFGQMSPREEQIPPLKQFPYPSPQAQQPPQHPSPPPCKDTKENILETIKEEIDADNCDSGEKSSDKRNHENAMENHGGGAAVMYKRKLTNREWRGRQNDNLRRLLVPKNALIVLNELLPGERAISQFKVEPVPPDAAHGAANTHSFCAELTVHGTNYKGYGVSKAAARNDAAEQVIRDLILKQLDKSKRRQQGAGWGGWDEAEGDEREPLPMIQLASFALHKLFAAWQGAGHVVPPLGAPAAAAGAGAGSAGGGAALPANAGAMQPCMLLAHVRPAAHYRALPAGDGAPYAMAVTLDGCTYTGTGASKKEARKEAARAACVEHFGVTFSDGV